MVFKRKARRSYRSFSRGSRRRSGGGSSGLSPVNVLLAGAIYGAARPLAAKMLPDMFSFGVVDSDNVIIAAAGFYGMKKGKGLMKALGTVALGSEVGIVTARLSQNLTSGTPTNQTSSYDY
jgi:hypothetical protein